MSQVWVGVDVGGTSVKVGAVTPGGEVRGEGNVVVPEELRRGDGDAGVLFDAVVAEATRLGGDGLERLGVGIPGLFDRATGVVQRSPNLPWTDGVSVSGELAARLGVPRERVALENDANVAALGEAWLGGGRDARHLLFVTLGTGVGGGLILDGELFVGEGGAGEIGHVIVDPGAEDVGVGLVGSVENLASATAAMRRARAAGLPEDLAALADAARRDDGPERRLLDAVGVDLGRGLAAVVMLLDVRTFVFGGGFAAALELLRPGILRGIAERDFGTRDGQVRILPAKLGARAGWIGAARLGREL